MALLALAIEWLRDREHVRWLWALAVFVPLESGCRIRRSSPHRASRWGCAFGLEDAEARNVDRLRGL